MGQDNGKTNRASAQWRKERPLARGVIDCFYDALMEVAHVSFVGNEQHNPGQPLHWDKAKSPDHADCILRHLGERGTTDTDGLLHSAKVAWRALALLQIEIEDGRKQAQFEEDHLGVKPVDPMDELVDTTDPHKPKPKAIEYPYPKEYGQFVYVAGPMRGFTELNFPAFDDARDHLLVHNWKVISPADLDRKLGKGTNRDYAKRDTTAILECDAIYMLKGWEKSVGATAEYALAKWAELTIFYQEEGMKCLP